MVSSVISAKMGINYPDLEMGNEFFEPCLGTQFLLLITTFSYRFLK